MPQSLDRWLPLLYPEPATVFDYLRDRPLFLCDTANCREALKNVLLAAERGRQDPARGGHPLQGVRPVRRGLRGFAAARVGVEQRAARHLRPLGGDIPLRDMIDVNAVQLSSWSGEFSLLREDVQNYLSRGYCVIVFAEPTAPP